MGRLFVLVLLLAIGGSTFWLVEPLTSRTPESADAITATEPPAVAGDTSGPEGDGAPAADDAARGQLDAPPGVPVPPLPDLPFRPSPDGYVWPLSKAKITTYFAVSASGSMILGGEPVHNGLDLALPCRTPIRAAHDGTVLYAGRRADPYLGFSGSVQPYYDELARRKLTDRALAIMVVIDDGNGLVSVYVHLAKATVKRGQVVRAGETVGFEGATGNATGCHLHYSLFIAGGPWAPVAPSLVEKWHYPAWMRLRIDPLLVLPLDSPDAARPVAGLVPPRDPPRYVAPTPTVTPPSPY